MLGGIAIRNRWIHTVYTLNIIIQAIISLLTPIGLLTLGAWALVTRCGVGEWIYAVLILIGVGIGLSSMLHFVLSATKQLAQLEKQNENNPKK